MAQTIVPKLYQSVIEDVISNVREAFIDEGYDEQSLTELKLLWEKKVAESKATEREPVPNLSRSAPRSLGVQPIQPQSMHVASAVLPESLTIPAGHHSSSQVGAGDTSKSGTCSNLPPKLAFTVPARLAQAGLQTLLTTTPGGATVQFPQHIAQLLQNNMLQAVTQSNPVQGGSQQIQGVHCQVLAPELQSYPQYTLAIPVTAPGKHPSILKQLDGPNDDTSDEEEDYSLSEDEDEDEEAQQDDTVEDEPLNSDDDESEEDLGDVFDTDNVVVCQYDKITRCKNRWKFILKDGIMNLKGKDYIFQRATGDSEW